MKTFFEITTTPVEDSVRRSYKFSSKREAMRWFKDCCVTGIFNDLLVSVDGASRWSTDSRGFFCEYPDDAAYQKLRELFDEYVKHRQ